MRCNDEESSHSSGDEGLRSQELKFQGDGKRFPRIPGFRSFELGKPESL